jgi:E1-E2 ATPase
MSPHCVTAHYADAMRRMLDRFSSLSQDDWEAFLGLPPRAKEIGAPGSGPDAAWPVKRPDPHPGVLVLPTVSLGLAVLANPLATAVNVPLIVYNALPIFRRAWMVWSRESRLNVDFLDTLAIAASIGQGHMVTGSLITWLVRLGNWIRDLTAAGSKRAASELLEFQAKTAWIVKEGAMVQIPAAKLAVGDAVVVYTGEMIPADGEILHGTAMIDQKTITGEGLPVPRTVGDGFCRHHPMRRTNDAAGHPGRNRDHGGADRPACRFRASR